jgi:ATP-binding cassette, subfamily B, multidrug efflux pump
VQPSILILDDSTSAVDVETEVLSGTALDEWMKGRTSFVIAQRISTVLKADKILVLDDGQIAARDSWRADRFKPNLSEIYESQLGNGGRRHG